jgi:NADPH-dependent glutamate synthase beta subunit-like oxidoreductase
LANVDIGRATGPGTSAVYHTGGWRTERPVYVDLLPPCSAACPASEEIQAWLYEAAEGSDGYEHAWRKIVEVNPMPAIMGRICYHPCQTACNRVQVDTQVGINAVERFLGDLALERGWSLPAPKQETGKRILIVGSGPAGLSASYHLRMLGHAVTVREAQEELGGMMRYGIPEYRLPRDILDAEVARIAATGVTFEVATPVTDLPAACTEFDAVLIAVGAGQGAHADIPAIDAKVLDAVTMLHDTAAGDAPLLGRRVAVYGGGNTAMDAARTARRLGASDTVIIYRRTQAQMPAHSEEFEDAVLEGVRAQWLTTIKDVDHDAIHVERMELDANGRPVPTGEFDEVHADAVVLAIGQNVDLTLVENDDAIDVTDGVIGINESMMTGRAGVFAAGDAAPGERTATFAIGQGRIAAHHMDAYLMGGEFTTPERPNQVPFSRLNTWYYSDAPEQVRDTLDAARRITGFEEVLHGLTETSALFEARRCMSCGNCFECDNCYGMCPDDAIIKLGPGKRFEIDLDYCKGCSICATECPCGAIDMVPETR